MTMSIFAEALIDQHGDSLKEMNQEERTKFIFHWMMEARMNEFWERAEELDVEIQDHFEEQK